MQANYPRNYSRLNAVSPARQVVDVHKQPSHVPPGLLRPTYTRPSTDMRKHRHVSPPLAIMPRPVTKSTPVHSRPGYRTRHSTDNTKVRQLLSIPAPLAPQLPNPGVK